MQPFLIQITLLNEPLHGPNQHTLPNQTHQKVLAFSRQISGALKHKLDQNKKMSIKRKA